jgi:hypothetical protein
MEKLVMNEKDCQIHDFSSLLKENLEQRGITIAYTQKTEVDFTSFRVTHIIPYSDSYLVESYDELTLQFLEAIHVESIASEIMSRLQLSPVGEIKLDSKSYFGMINGNHFDKGWHLITDGRVRPFVPPKVVCILG